MEGTLLLQILSKHDRCCIQHSKAYLLAISSPNCKIKKKVQNDRRRNSKMKDKLKITKKPFPNLSQKRLVVSPERRFLTWRGTATVDTTFYHHRQIGRTGRWDVPSADRPVCRLGGSADWTEQHQNADTKNTDTTNTTNTRRAATGLDLQSVRKLPWQ